ncbi:zinc finger protein basonuclin-2 [Hypomesus transpacificus]|uniref:zinc finger protein basonuclin-2 n=1 Tax=Hypomesus transpacificus TaxID=137520 RepID=UPI001F072CCB|nr:zinc finger protein basonuclin-2 [Hypomesus transpacificus]
MGSWKPNPDLLFLHGTQHGTRPDMKTDVTTTRSSDETLRCTQGSCSCQSYQPGQLRTCLDCRHGWVFHALDKLQAPVCGGAQAEVVVPGVVFDLSSLVLFGAQAVPVRMKILLDRLLSVLPQHQVLHTLLPLGWSLRDYIRGYMLQDSTGRVLDRWLMLSQEEEAVILPHFLRFGETRPIVELMMQQDSQANHVAPSGVRPAPQTQSNLQAFIENSLRNPPPSSRTPGTLSQLQNSGGGSTSLHPLKSLTSDLSWLLQLPSPSLLLDLTPPTRPGRVIRLGGDQNKGVGEGPGTGLGSGSSSGSRPVSLTQNNSRTSSFQDPRTPSLSSLSTSPPSTLPPLLSSFPPSLSSSLLSLGVRKGRVSCTACGKSFYDKGNQRQPIP